MKRCVHVYAYLCVFVVMTNRTMQVKTRTGQNSTGQDKKTNYRPLEQHYNNKFKKTRPDEKQLPKSMIIPVNKQYKIILEA